MKDYKIKIGQVTYSCFSANPFTIHIEHENGSYDCVDVEFSFDSQEQFEEYVIILDMEYWK